MRVRDGYFDCRLVAVAWWITAAAAAIYSGNSALAQTRANEGGEISIAAPATERRPLGPSRPEEAAPATPAKVPGPPVPPQGVEAPSAPAPSLAPPEAPTPSPAPADDDRLDRLARKLASPEPANSAPRAAVAGREKGALGGGAPLSKALATSGDARHDEASRAVGHVSDADTTLASPTERMALGTRRSASGDRTDSGALEPAGGSGWISQTIGALAVVVLMIFAARAVLSRWLRRGSSGGRAVVEVLTRTPIAARSSVLLLRLGGRILVVADGPGGMRTLAELDDAEEVAELLAAVTASQSGSVTHSFRQLFDRFNKDTAEASDPVEHGEDGEEVHVDRTRDRLSGLLAKMRALGEKEAARV